jgi:hypothetical protein
MRQRGDEEHVVAGTLLHLAPWYDVTAVVEAPSTEAHNTHRNVTTASAAAARTADPILCLVCGSIESRRSDWEFANGNSIDHALQSMEKEKGIHEHAPTVFLYQKLL